MLFRLASVASLLAFAASASAVAFEMTTSGHSLCIRMVKGSYDKTYCISATYSKQRDCYLWGSIITKPRYCSPDGAFCFDLFDNGWAEVTESAITYTVGNGYFTSPTSGSIDCNYSTQTCTNTAAWKHTSNGDFC